MTSLSTRRLHASVVATSKERGRSALQSLLTISEPASVSVLTAEVVALKGGIPATVGLGEEVDSVAGTDDVA